MFQSERKYRSNTIDGFDLSRLLEDDPKQGSRYSQPLDEIDLMIKNQTLVNNSSVINQIMEELQLHKFWNELKISETHHLFEFLAVDRILNFYEGATGAGFSINDLRIGIVVAAMTSALRVEGKPTLIPTRWTPTPCFSLAKTVSLDEFDLKCLTEGQLWEAKELIKEFSRKEVKVKRMSEDNRIKVYLADAFRMWTLSKDKTLIAFMTQPIDRSKFVDPHKVESFGLYNELGHGYMGAYKPLIELTLFNTVWARTKSFNYNIPAVVRKLMGIC